MKVPYFLWQVGQPCCIESITFGAGPLLKLVEKGDGLFTWVIFILIFYHARLQWSSEDHNEGSKLIYITWIYSLFELKILLDFLVLSEAYVTQFKQFIQYFSS